MAARFKFGVVEREMIRVVRVMFMFVCAPGSHKDLFISLLLFIFIIKTNATIIIKEEGGRLRCKTQGPIPYTFQDISTLTNRARSKYSKIS